jgi:nucleotide-binding universal stress UspA family protein
MACLSLPLLYPEAVPEFRFRSILLPTDFGGASDRAARVAHGLATRFRSRLHVVHALWQRDYEWDEAVACMGAGEASGLKRSEEFVLAHGLDAATPEVIVMPGSPTEVVQTIAAEKNVDLLVLGTDGLPWPAKLVFGTYSEQIYRNARSPVLTVGPYVRPAKCRGEFQSIVFAINLESEFTVSALQYAVALTRAFDARLTVACVLPKSFGANGEELYRVQDRLQSEKRAELLRLFEEIQLPLPHAPEIVVETGHISEGIIKIAMRSNADLIVKGVRPPEPHATGGYTYPISVNAPCPVLTVGVGMPKKSLMRCV